MSKKNKLSTRRKSHADVIAREKDAAEKKVHKAQAAQSLKLRTIEAGGITKSQRKKARQPLRIRKGVTIRGIKVKDSESKRKIKALLRDEAAIKKAQNTMDEDEEGWEEVQGAELEAMAV